MLRSDLVDAILAYIALVVAWTVLLLVVVVVITLADLAQWGRDNGNT